MKLILFILIFPLFSLADLSSNPEHCNLRNSESRFNKTDLSQIDVLLAEQKKEKEEIKKKKSKKAESIR